VSALTNDHVRYSSSNILLIGSPHHLQALNVRRKEELRRKGEEKGRDTGKEGEEGGLRVVEWKSSLNR
jgi:hypothetical protein